MARARSRVLRTVLFLVAAPGVSAQAVIHELTGPHPFGYAATGLGDADGDGLDDFAIGESSAIRGYSGADGALMFEITGIAPFALVGIGDADGDGLGDLAYMAFGGGASGGGSGALYSPAAQAEIAPLLLPAGAGFIGATIAAPGDVDGDGAGDVVLSGRLPNPGDWFVHVRSGADGSILHQRVVSASVVPVAGLGDVNGDGHADFAYGSPNESTPHPGISGVVFVHSGLDGALLYRVTSETFTGYGRAIGDVGDVNDDGVTDLAVIFGCVKLFVHSGVDGRLLYRVDDPPNEPTGPAAICFDDVVDGIDDVDGDGFDDFVVQGNATTDIDYGEVEPRVFVCSGKTGRRILSMTLRGIETWSGRATASVGDVNGDGIADVLTASTAETLLGGPDDGYAAVFSAGPVSLRSDAVIASSAPGATVRFGLNAGAKHGGATYALLGSATGISPGIEVGGGLVLPLASDAYTQLTSQARGVAPFAGFAGTLDADGRATAELEVGSLPASVLTGRRLHHAFVATSPGGEAVFVSNYTTLLL